MNAQLVIGIMFAALMGLISLVVVSMPVDFALGMLFGVGLYQLGYYFKHGCFFD